MISNTGGASSRQTLHCVPPVNISDRYPTPTILSKTKKQVFPTLERPVFFDIENYASFFSSTTGLGRGAPNCHLIMLLGQTVAHLPHPIHLL